MSGGYFEYQQFRLHDMVQSINELIARNDDKSVDLWGNPCGAQYSPQTLDKFKHATHMAKITEAMLTRVDWLVSGDDDEDSFHRRWDEELGKVKEDQVCVEGDTPPRQYKHSCGPWRVASESQNEGEAFVIANDTHTIAWTANTQLAYSTSGTTEVDAATAKLISRAPQLVELLERALAQPGLDTDLKWLINNELESLVTDL